jgi:hypothetical protein
VTPPIPHPLPRRSIDGPGGNAPPENVNDPGAESIPPAHGAGCACRRCEILARRAAAMARPLPVPTDGDFYLEGSVAVFTAQFHRRRGYCCGNDCRHCPYDDDERAIALRRSI